jgi:glycosyltransferase involved in cell wall biosynthesis/peptidoglycan/xylan/chitin deacetylase (PgdA/CDA1 family)
MARASFETRALAGRIFSELCMPRTPVKFSVVIPTFNRRDVVSASILALERQRFSEPFEVVVVVDGSTDGTAAWLRSLAVSFPMIVLEQNNSGASVARNHGAQAARGEIIVFLDDDMEADPDLLAEHMRCHESGADIVIGHIPLHPDSPQGILKRAVGVWAEERLARLSSLGAEPTLHDVLTGQLSMRKETFEAIGGFDTAFTRDGSFGNEDMDFGYRVQQLGLRIVFNPRAVSWQRYVVGADDYLSQRHDLGRADVAFARKHPERTREIFLANGAEHWRNRLIWRPILRIPFIAPLLARALSRSALALVNRGSPPTRLARRLFREASFVQYWSGVRDAGGIPRDDPPRVLAYHSIRELPEESPLAPYTIPPQVFEKQLDTLIRAGFHFVDANAVLDYLSQRRSLPPRAILLTFDDCYTDLLDFALPILRARRIPAIAFTVSGQIGGVNEWDRHLGAPDLGLLDGDGLRMLANAGMEIGAHSRTHPVLTRVTDSQLTAEVEGCASEIEALGLPRPRLFAYPYGEFNDCVEAALRASGFDAAFTVQPAPLRREINPLLLPRIAIFSTDVGERFAWTVSGAGFAAQLRRTVRLMHRDLRRAWQETAAREPLDPS